MVSKFEIDPSVQVYPVHQRAQLLSAKGSRCCASPPYGEIWDREVAEVDIMAIASNLQSARGN